ncbi:hypothetical protein LINPERPRIM_LOCUS15097 [Linum perenne]
MPSISFSFIVPIVVHTFGQGTPFPSSFQSSFILSAVLCRHCKMGTKGSASVRIMLKLRKDSHLTVEFSYEDDDVICFLSEAYIVHELEAIKARLSRVEDAVFSRR